MSNFNIGLSGIDTVQKAFDVIGSNISNASSEGYHRQRVELRPVAYSSSSQKDLISGVRLEKITRVMDTLLEQELVRQKSQLAQVSRESTTLQSIETALGELSTEGGGLNAAIDKFFNALQDLSVHPADMIWQNQVISEAEAMASQFRSLGEFLTALESSIRIEAEQVIESINTLAQQIADLNQTISKSVISGGQANTLRDQRDQYITQLAELISIQTQERDFGSVDVSVGGIPLVMTNQATSLNVSLDGSGVLAVSILDSFNYESNLTGGKLGALLSLNNDIMNDIHNDLNTLAKAIIQKINSYHVEGVSPQGSFQQLTGWTNTSGNLSTLDGVSAGYTYIRVTHTTTGAVTRTAIPVLQDTSSDTLTEIAQYISTNVANVTASVNASSQLTITAATGYKFDFLPAVLPQPLTVNIDFNGTVDPSISLSGVYAGNVNDTLTFTVAGTGTLGVTGTLTLTVQDSALNTLATINIGAGYAAGDDIQIGNTGILVALGTGDLVAGDSFSVDVFADTDTAGLLSATGINTFFSGHSASTIAVHSYIVDTPGKLAASLGGDMTDNANVLRMVGVKDESSSDLDALTASEFYRRLVTNIGQQISVKQRREENLDVIVQNLMTQQSEISGVDINQEAAELLIYEQMFQALAKYMNTVHVSIASLMDIT